MFFTSLYRSVRLALFACTLVIAASVAFAQAPTAPTNVVATVSGTKINLSWTAVSGAKSYLVYRSTTSGSGYKTVGTPTSHSASDSKVIAGQPYYYVVSAVNASGESAKSAEVTAATPAPASAPSAPTNVTATAGSGKVSLAWTPSATANSYIVYRSTTSGSGYKLIGTPTGPTGTDRKVVPGTTYYYVVSAVNIKGEGSKSTEVSAKASP